MRVVLSFVALVGVVSGYDSVIFSSKTTITDEYPSMDVLLERATPELPLVFLVNPDFKLAQFSRQAGAYGNGESSSNIVAAAKSATSRSAKFIPYPVYTPEASFVSATTPLQKGSTRVIILQADNWSSLDALAKELLAELGENVYAVVITNTEAVSQESNVESLYRAKRQDPTIPNNAPANGDGLAFPVTMPPYNRSGVAAPVAKQCLFFLEGINLVYKNAEGRFFTAVQRENETEEDKTVNRWNWDDSYITCELANGTVGPATVTLDFANIVMTEQIVDGPGNNFKLNEPSFGLKLNFVGTSLGYWALSSATITKQLSFSVNSETVTLAVDTVTRSVEYMAMGSVFSYGWNCQDSQAMWFNGTADGTLVGISFHHVQYQIYHLDTPNDGDGTSLNTSSKFTHRVDSCYGTFSPASWMAIITSFLLFIVFIFGFVMLNNVQTQNNFDDPKQKQIIINVRE